MPLAALLTTYGVLAYLLSVAAHYLLAAFESANEAERRALAAEVSANFLDLVFS